MKFLVDVQLPLKLAEWLRRQGVDAVHALDRDLGQALDHELWQLAQADGRILISKDEDFFILASRPSDQGRLLWVRLGNSRTRPLLETFEKQWNRIVEAFNDQQQVVELR